jgi:hypothetical protein
MNMAVQTSPSDDERIEGEIQRKGKTGARIAPEDIAAAVVGEHYFTALQGARMRALDVAADAAPSQLAARFEAHGIAPLEPALGLLTFCVLVLRNGFTVTGESACVSPENFDAEIGRKVARQKAVEKIWPLEGYLLKQRLHETA